MSKIYNQKELINFKKIFFRFLKENNCLKSYLKEIYINKEKLPLNKFIENNYHKIYFRQRIISCSFLWENTKNGDTFWRTLQSKWEHDVFNKFLIKN